MTSPRQQNLSLEWTKHLSSSKEKEDFIQLLKNNRYILSRLKDILLEKIKNLETNELKDDFYEDTNYAFKQAFVNGRKKELKAILDLLFFI